MQKYIFLSLLVFALASGASAQDQGSGILSRYILTPTDFNDGNVTFTIDTPTVSYRPYHARGLGLSNSSPMYRDFAYCVLQDDPAAKMTLTVDTGGVKVDTVEVKTGNPITLNFTLSTSLKPTGTQRTFQLSVLVHIATLFQGIFIPFAIDTVKFAATFPSLPAKGVAMKIQDNISLRINPNPVFGRTMLSLLTSKLESVTLEIYDMLGNRKAILASGEYVNVACDFRFDATGFPAGMYFARLVTGTTIITKKIVVEK